MENRMVDASKILAAESNPETKDIINFTCRKIDAALSHAVSILDTPEQATIMFNSVFAFAVERHLLWSAARIKVTNEPALYLTALHDLTVTAIAHTLKNLHNDPEFNHVLGAKWGFGEGEKKNG